MRPENTVEAFRYARETGAHGVELDVHVCASGEVVVFHDETVERLTDGEGRLEAMTLGELRELRVRGPRPPDMPESELPEPTSSRIPILEEVIETLGPEMLIDIELKGRTGKPDGLELKLLRLVRRMGAGRRVVYTSFNPVRLLRLRRHGWSLPLGMLFYHGNPRWIRDRWTEPLVQPKLLAPFHEDIGIEMMRDAARDDLSVWTWTVNRPEDARRVAKLGVRAIITDDPAKLLALDLKAGT